MSSRTISADGDFVGLLAFISVVVSAVLLSLWYLYFAGYNRRKGALALRHVELACSARGEIIETRWQGVCSLQARLGFLGHWFENARVVIRLRPRPVPLEWLLSLARGQRETLTFEADLDFPPGFHLELFRHRWVSKPHTRISKASAQWEVSHPGPVVLTTRSHWSHELTPVVNTLITSRGHSLVSVRFRSESPHLAATIPLEALSDEQAAAEFLSMLRELAVGASTRQQ
jgi:hypothetical protein